MLSFFPRDVLDEILNLIESVSEDFPSYSLPYMDITPSWSCDLDHLKRFPLPQHLQILHKIRSQLAIQTTVYNPMKYLQALVCFFGLTSL